MSYESNRTLEIRHTYMEKIFIQYVCWSTGWFLIFEKKTQIVKSIINKTDKMLRLTYYFTQKKSIYFRMKTFFFFNYDRFYTFSLFTFDLFCSNCFPWPILRYPKRIKTKQKSQQNKVLSTRWEWKLLTKEKSRNKIKNSQEIKVEIHDNVKNPNKVKTLQTFKNLRRIDAVFNVTV